MAKRGRRHGELSEGIARIEGGLTDRQKEELRKLVVEVVARLLQSEAQAPGAISTYTRLYDLTQDVHWHDWQRSILEREPGADHPAKTAILTLIQLIQTDLLIEALQGYLSRTREVAHNVLERVKLTSNAVIRAYEGRITRVTANDKDGEEWQMYTAPSAPDSVIVRRIQKPRK